MKVFLGTLSSNSKYINSKLIYNKVNREYLKEQERLVKINCDEIALNR